jgi:hypothetical protein
MALPDRMVSLIDALLDKDPRRRPPHTRRVRQALRSVGRGLPLSSRNSLQGEARPYFRSDPLDELPPLIPEALGQRGRSALVPTGTRAARFWHRLKSLRWPARATLAGSVLLLGAIPALLAHVNAVTPVRFAEPVTSMAGGTYPPGPVSSYWLVGQVKAALGEQLGSIRVMGPVGSVPESEVWAGGRPLGLWARSEQSFQLALNCIQGLCVFAISREEEGDRFHRQSVLLPEMTVREWRDVVRDTTLALYQ